MNFKAAKFEGLKFPGTKGGRGGNLTPPPPIFREVSATVL